METRVLLLVLRIAAVLPRLVSRRRAEPVCRLVGDLWYLGAPAARAAVRANLTHVLGRPPSPRRVREVFRQGVLNYWDTLAISDLGPRGIGRLVTVTGTEHLDQALARGHGAILVGAHIGSIALATQALAVRGYRITGVVERMRQPELLRFWLEKRRALGVNVVAADPAVARLLLATLRRNEIVALVTDRDVVGTGPVVGFFGVATTFPDGAAALSLRTGAPVLPAVAARRPDGTFAGRIEPPLAPPGAGKAREDVRGLTQAIAERLEYHIRSYPEQWTVFQPRWPAPVAPTRGTDPGPPGRR